MTKKWAEVKEEICLWYKNGRTLKSISDERKQTRGFDASTRAYRLKLDEWNVKRGVSNKLGRSDASMSCGADGNSCSGSGTPYDPVIIAGSPNQTNVHSPRPLKRRSVATMCASLLDQVNIPTESTQNEDLRLDNISSTRPDVQTFQDPISLHSQVCNDMHEADLDSSSSLALPSELREMYIRIEQMLLWKVSSTGLRESDLQDNTDSILHYAASRSDDKVLSHIIDFMVQNGIKANIRDTANCTALEVAIQANATGNVGVLLGSFPLPEFGPDQHLHVAIAIGADWTICKMLLEHGADANRIARVSPLCRALTVLETKSVKHAQNLYLQIQVLLESGADWSSNEQTCTRQYDTFVSSVRRLQKVPESFLKSLGYFLQRGFSPSLPFQTVCCSSESCTLDTFAMYHADKMDLANVIVDNVDIIKYGQDVANILVSSGARLCRSSSSCIDRPKLLQTLLQRGAKFVPGRNPVSQVLEASGLNNKSELLNNILTFDEDLIRQHDVQLGPAMICLLGVKVPWCWQLAETLLSTIWQRDVYNYRLVGALEVALKTGVFCPFEDSINQFLSFVNSPKEQLSSTEYDRLLQCIVHALTKHALEATYSKLEDCTRERLTRMDSILQLRSRYSLPNVSVPTKIFIAVLSTALNFASSRKDGTERSSPGYTASNLPPEDDVLLHDFFQNPDTKLNGYWKLPPNFDQTSKAIPDNWNASWSTRHKDSMGRQLLPSPIQTNQYNQQLEDAAVKLKKKVSNCELQQNISIRPSLHSDLSPDSMELPKNLSLDLMTTLQPRSQTQPHLLPEMPRRHPSNPSSHASPDYHLGTFGNRPRNTSETLNPASAGRDQASAQGFYPNGRQKSIYGNLGRD